MDKTLLSKTILTAFLADSYVLPAHWCYNTTEILQKYPTLLEANTLLGPGLLNNYHEGKKAGEFTHYGDQMFWLLDHVDRIRKRPGTLASWRDVWFQKMTLYTGYKDHASKTTLDNYQQNMTAGDCKTMDLSGVSRFIPLLLLPNVTLEQLITEAKAQMTLTHSNPELDPICEFFVRWVYLTQLHPSMPPSILLKDISVSEQIQTMIEKALKAVEQTRGLKNDDFFEQDQQAINSFGEIKQFGNRTVATARSCGYPGAVPSVIYLVCKYETMGVLEALKVNVVMGGDSSARGILIAALLSPFTQYHSLFDFSPELAEHFMSDVLIKLH
jgi:ADP-ribosylglycohydrolase